MQATFRALVCLALAVAIGAPAHAEDKDPLDGLKCFMMKKKDVKGKKVVDYKEGKLYLCCSTCVKRMDKYPEKYEALANHQLVVTKQYKQGACPITGKDVDASAKLTIGGVEVHFADAATAAKVKGMDEDDQVTAAFGKDGFKAGKFALIKEKK
ncbi:MAG: hypothetical protein AAF483_02745 [Planctomycetota bacterium]